MNYLFKKLTVFALVFSFLLTPLSVFGYNLEYNNSLDETQIYNIDNDTYALSENDIELLNLYDVIEFEIADENHDVENFAIFNPVTVAAIKAALSRIGASAAFKSMTTHALQQANLRKITADAIAKLMSRGTKYTDKVGDKILYDASSKNALVLDKTGKVVKTAMNEVNLNKKILNKGWKLGNW